MDCTRCKGIFKLKLIWIAGIFFQEIKKYFGFPIRNDHFDMQPSKSKRLCNGVFGGDSIQPTVIASVENVVKAYGDVCLRKARRKRQKLLLLELLYEYAKNSTLHGLGYIVEQGLHYIERVFWFVTFCMSLAMCFLLIRNVWAKWITSPVIVSFSEKFVSVGEVPFPSITICPEQKVDAAVFNYTHYYQKYVDYRKMKSPNKTEFFDKENFQKLSHLDTVCGEMRTVELHQNITDSSLVKDIMEAAPTVSEVFNYCEWRGTAVHCDDIFKLVLTKKGVCFNFNALAANETLRTENLQNVYKYSDHINNSTDWSPTGGYTEFREETYPRRGMENQGTPDLDIILTESLAANDSLCNIFRNGFTIYVQHPRDLPQASLYYYAAIPGQVSSLALKFSRLYTADSLKDYTPEARQCYFPDDRQLRYFKIYTSNNCRLECQSNYTFHKCGCVWFHMPHNDSNQLCSIENEYCVQEALEELSKAEVKNDKSDDTPKCQCLPLCDAVQYDAEILKTNFLVKEYFRYLEKRNIDVREMASKKYSKIEVYFKEPRFISMRRSELFGITDFLANCGGLLGLFLGFSFLSIVEIGYFGTLRLYFRLRKDRRHEKMKQKEEEKQ